MGFLTKGEPYRGKQGHVCRPRLAKGGLTDAGNGGRSRHVAQGADTSGGGWQVAGMGDGQVDNAPLWERRWKAGLHIGVTTTNGC